MSNQRGFTMLEVLFVLAIWAILLTISAPLYFPVIDSRIESDFINTFKMDLLYMQNLSFASDENYRLTFPDSNRYIIRKGHGEIIREREVPDQWEVDSRTLPLISFNKMGTIIEPGSFFIKTKSTGYKVICPLGKGRCYFDEQ